MDVSPTKEGMAPRRPLRAFTTADSWPAMNVSGASAISMAMASMWRARRSARAASSTGILGAGVYTTACCARSAPAARTRPSSTRWGACVSSNASFRLAGSPSAPLAITTGRRREAPATAFHLVETGNQAPPWPTSPLASSSSTSRRSRRRGSPHRSRCVASPGSGVPPESPWSSRLPAAGAVWAPLRKVRLIAPRSRRAVR